MTAAAERVQKKKVQFITTALINKALMLHSLRFSGQARMNKCVTKELELC